MPTGFSIAILSQCASAKYMKNTTAFCCLKSFCFSGNHLAPLTAKSVHGGNAIIMSQCPTCVCVCVKRLERAVTIQKWTYLLFDMPLRVTAGRINYVAGKRFMALLSERFTYSLRFFTSY